jgi:hypothetical protein
MMLKKKSKAGPAPGDWSRAVDCAPPLVRDACRMSLIHISEEESCPEGTHDGSETSLLDRGLRSRMLPPIAGVSGLRLSEVGGMRTRALARVAPVASVSPRRA